VSYMMAEMQQLDVDWDLVWVASQRCRGFCVVRHPNLCFTSHVAVSICQHVHVTATQQS
jgi:hypothetical protein